MKVSSVGNVVQTAVEELRNCPPQLAFFYAIVYFAWGMAMDQIGQAARIAQFLHWWQVLSVYVLYLAPVSIAFRRASWMKQYAVGVLALAPIELIGYRIGSSVAHEGNLLDTIFGPRNFTLVMTVFFGSYIPIGNAAVLTFSRWIGLPRETEGKRT